MQVSAESRITSYSTSFQPTRLRSSRTWVMGLLSSPRWTASSNSDFSWMKPPPVPPRV